MSILPNKYTPTSHSLIGVAAYLATSLKSNDTVSTLWDRVREDERVRTFDRFADGLTILYAVKVITMRKGVLELTASRQKDGQASP